MKGRSIGIGVAAVLVMTLAIAPAAFGFGLSSPNAQPANLQAGANSDLSIRIDIQQPEAQLRDLTIHLPPGLVGNPLATVACTEEQLNAIACPAASDVGDVSNDVVLSEINGVPIAPVSQTVHGNVYNVVPRQGEPGRFGIVLESTPLTIPGALPPIVLQSPARLRQSDFGLDTVLTDLPQTATIAAGQNATIEISSISLNLAGRVGNPPTGFLRNPTSCNTAAISFDGRAYTGETASGQAPSFTPTNCGALPFSPELTARARPGGQGDPVELTTNISQTIEEAGLANAQVILPTGLTGDQLLLPNQCLRPDFEAGNCPPQTMIGTAEASSPLQASPLTGAVYLIEPATPGLPDIGLDLRGSLALKLTGSLDLGADGRAITSFAGLPDIPIADFSLTFGREPGFVIAGLDLCDSPPLAVDGSFTAHSGAATTVAAPIQLRGCKPRAKVKLAKLGSDEPRLKLKVKAGAENLRTARLRLPKELSLATGRTFRRGTTAKADGDKLKRSGLSHRRRALKLRGKDVERFVAKVGEGALKAKQLDRRRLTFKLKITDRSGDKTRLTLRVPLHN